MTDVWANGLTGGWKADDMEQLKKKLLQMTEAEAGNDAAQATFLAIAQAVAAAVEIEVPESLIEEVGRMEFQKEATQYVLQVPFSPSPPPPPPPRARRAPGFVGPDLRIIFHQEALCVTPIAKLRGHAPALKSAEGTTCHRTWHVVVCRRSVNFWAQACPNTFAISSVKSQKAKPKDLIIHIQNLHVLTTMEYAARQGSAAPTPVLRISAEMCYSKTDIPSLVLQVAIACCPRSLNILSS